MLIGSSPDFYFQLQEVISKLGATLIEKEQEMNAYQAKYKIRIRSLDEYKESQQQGRSSENEGKSSGLLA